MREKYAGQEDHDKMNKRLITLNITEVTITKTVLVCHFRLWLRVQGNHYYVVLGTSCGLTSLILQEFPLHHQNRSLDQSFLMVRD